MLLTKKDEINEFFYNTAHQVTNHIIDKIPKNEQYQVDIGFRVEKAKPDALDIEYAILKSSVEKVVNRLESVSVFSYEPKKTRKNYAEMFLLKSLMILPV